MAELQGLGVSPGIAVGPAATMAPPLEVPTADHPVRDPDVEARSAADALEAVAAELEERGARAGGEAEAVLGAEAMMARDPALSDRVNDLISSGGRSAARAVHEAFGGYRELLQQGGDYVAARVADLDDLANRTVARLLGVPMRGVPDPGHPFVLLARDLAPADTATLHPERVLAVVTEEGGPTSHTAILARSLGVPAVVACPGATSVAEGVTVIVDGASGRVVVEPGAAAVEQAIAAGAARRRARREARGPGRTADGHPVPLLANLGEADGVAAAVAAGAEGVGLLRTEFLFLDRSDAPSAEEQTAAYAEVFSAFPGAKVVVRTLDAGADKPLAFLDLGPEENPALGIRGLRVSRARPEVLDIQLEAIGRAASQSSTEVWVMAPMVATPEEARWFASQTRAAALGTVGVMVEVPAAALAAGAILAEVDFASIGTNDLAQYAFAADRMRGGLAALQDPWQPVLLRLVHETASAGERAGKPVGVCGEAASDPALACVLVGLGVTSLSMGAAAIADVRAALAAHSLDDCRRLAGIAAAAAGPSEGRAAVRASSPALADLGL